MRTTALAITLALLGPAVLSAPSDGPAGAPCYLTVTVPVGATLTVNGARTEQMTAVRKFVSPALPNGKKFYYTFEATYTSGGESLVRKQTVEVTAGADVAVNMLAAAVVAPEKSPAAPRTSPFESKPKAKGK